MTYWAAETFGDGKRSVHSSVSGWEFYREGDVQSLFLSSLLTLLVMTKWQPWAKSNLYAVCSIPFISSSRFPIWEKRKWKTKFPYSFIIEKENFLPSVPPTYNRRVRLTISPCLRKTSFRKRVSSFPLSPWPVISIAFWIVVIEEKVWFP